MLGRARVLRRRLTEWLRSPEALVITLAALAQVAVLVSIRLSSNDVGGDLCRDTVAIQRLLHGENPYMPIPSCGVLRNLPHPPAALVLIAPFVLLPVQVGALLWDVLALAALATAVILIVRELGPKPGPWRLAALLTLVILFPPLLNALLEAQISPLLLLLCTLAWRWTRRERTTPAGIVLGLAAALRLFPALALLYYAIRRDWRALVAAGLTFILGSAVLLPFIGIDGYLAYATREAPSANAQWITSGHNASLWGFASTLLGAGDPKVSLLSAPTLARPAAALLAFGLVCLLALNTAWRRYVAARADQRALLAYVPAMLLVSPLTWGHYLVMALLPLLVLAADTGLLGSASSTDLGAGDAEPGGTLTRWLIGAVLGLIWGNGLLGGAIESHPLPTALKVLNSGAPTLALLLLTVALLYQAPRPAPPRERVPIAAEVHRTLIP